MNSRELEACYLLVEMVKDSYKDDGEDEDEEETGCLREDGETLPGLGLLDKLQWFLRSKMESKPLAFSSIDDKILENHLQITRGPPLALKSDYETLLADSVSFGASSHMSSTRLKEYLVMLEVMTPAQDLSNPPLWINILLLRTASMVPTGKKLVSHPQFTLPPIAVHETDLMTITGTVAHAILVANEDLADSYRDASPLVLQQNQDDITIFFVIQVKVDCWLQQCIPQAVAAMYGCAKFFGKRIIRGALSNGRDWQFLILHLKDEYNTRGTFTQTRPFAIDRSVSSTLSGADLVAGILSSWIHRSYQDITSDDYFQYM
ncbi:hypothetical protein BT69DRAFT_1349547 [Atractiella rhizophila]|nr:hypothetical protein BT69DRAFT_1349547 [Atractiella rhizophila]